MQECTQLLEWSKVHCTPEKVKSFLCKFGISLQLLSWGREAQLRHHVLADDGKTSDNFENVMRSFGSRIRLVSFSDIKSGIMSLVYFSWKHNIPHNYESISENETKVIPTIWIHSECPTDEVFVHARVFEGQPLFRIFWIGPSGATWLASIRRKVICNVCIKTKTSDDVLILSMFAIRLAKRACSNGEPRPLRFKYQPDDIATFDAAP